MSAPAAPPRATGGFDPDRAWRLHPQVAVRPEPFGALLYHFGTRKLSFLKNPTILAVVKSLADHADARSACRAADVDPAHDAAYFGALGVLVDSDILVPAQSRDEAESGREAEAQEPAEEPAEGAEPQ